VVLVSFFVTFAGWWAWNAFLSGVYAPAPSPYSVRDGFKSTFGPDPVWWLTLVVVVAVFCLMELTAKTARRNLVVAGLWKWPPWQRKVLSDSVEEWDVELWQEMEQDPVLRERLRLMAKGGEDEEADNAQQAGDNDLGEVDLGRVL
jgi:phospholipid-translocating ATPase